MMKKYIPIGKFFKPVGTEGELKFDIEDNYIDDFVRGDHFFIKINGSFVPYFVENIREANSYIIKIEEVDSPEVAALFNQKEIFLRESSISSAAHTMSDKRDNLIDYRVFDGNIEVGTIIKIEKFPQQIMAWVDVRGRILPIPLAEPMISSIDHELKSITMQLPEGILDI